MFFENEIISFHILDVLEIDQKNINIRNLGRNFNALSFRIRSDAKIKTDNKEYRFKDKSVAFVPSRCDYTRSATVDKLIAVHFDTIDYLATEIETFKPYASENLQRLFETLLTIWNQKEKGYKYKASAVFYEILAECFEQNSNSAKKNSKIEKSTEYLLKNFNKADLSIGKIAAKSFVSEVYFRKLFKKEYGISPQKYNKSTRTKRREIDFSGILFIEGSRVFVGV